MKKAFGIILFLGMIFVFFLMLRECNSSGGGNSPLSYKFQKNMELS